MTTHNNDQSPDRPGDEKSYWLDRKENIEKVVWAVYGICGLLFVIDIFVEKHGKGPFAIDHFYAFYGIYGFVACVALVLAAKQLRRVLMRGEDYYDR